MGKKATEQVCARILKGLDRTQYRPMSDDDWKRMNGRAVWKRLAKLALGGAPLPPRARAELEQLQVQYSWTLSPINQDEFPAWHEEGWVGVEVALPIEELRRKTSHELIALVTHQPDEPVASRLWSHYTAFGKLLKEQPSKVIRVLLQLALSRECPSRFVSQVLEDFSGEEPGRFHRSHWRYAGMALAALQDDCLVECAIDVSRAAEHNPSSR